MKKVLILGAGEQASGTAHRLVRAGFQVIMTELPEPKVVRRTVSFAEAVYKGSCQVEGVEARLVDTLHHLTARFEFIPLLIDPAMTLIRDWKPDVLVDARILKRNDCLKKDLAPLVIGLGPGIESGKDAHAVVETNRGHNLGRVITSGFTQPNTGVPGEIGAHSIKRVLRSPAEGTFLSDLNIGDPVFEAQIIGSVAGTPIHALIAGILRGQIRPGTQVVTGQKIGDVDPRGSADACLTISDKARNISGSVLEIILSWMNHGTCNQSRFPASHFLPGCNSH